MSRRAHLQPRARTAVAPIRSPARVIRALPSGRSLGVGILLAVLASAAYLGARESSAFAIRDIRVTGVPAPLARDVRRALAPLEGQSMLKLQFAEVDGLATALPQVASVTYDRAFPNTLRVTVTPEVPLAVVRQGSSAWLVSRRGRLIKELQGDARPALPRIWLRQTFELRLGGTLEPEGGGAQAAALAPLEPAGLAGRVKTVRIEDGQIVYVLRDGLDLRAGGTSRLPLKLEIARRILGTTPVSGYLDVSVPERPVAGDNPQLSG